MKEPKIKYILFLIIDVVVISIDLLCLALSICEKDWLNVLVSSSLLAFFGWAAIFNYKQCRRIEE